jgi:hypothetical protein
MASSILIALLLAAIAASVPAVAHAQEGMRSPLSGNSLDVLVEPTWSDGGQASFKVSFLQPGSDTVQIHIDYNLVIRQDGQVVFRATPPGQPLLHTAEGVVMIPPPNQPYKFPSNGDYTIEVSVAGINFIPMSNETATFDVVVTPEFPPAALGGMAAVLVTTAIVLARYRRLL